MKQMSIVPEIGSVVMAAGRGSRMTGFDGNKTLLPLIPGRSVYDGKTPMLLHILSSLPSGPKALVIHHRKDDVVQATETFDLTYCEQPVLNGTGGALIATREFLQDQRCKEVIITMGDVPLVRPETYLSLIRSLEDKSLVVLGFRPQSKKQYGVLEIVEDRVNSIIEWKYWHKYPEELRAPLQICNSGIYAGRRAELLKYLGVLAARPHKVKKEVDGKPTEVEEFFITDIIQFMREDGLSVGYVIAEDEREVMGVDDLEALKEVQTIFAHR